MSGGRPDSLRERIVSDLRARLVHGEIGADQRLVDLDIAAAYGTSRMPAREALLQLVNEGYLVGTTRGFCVPRLSREDIREVFEVRRLLEPRAAALAARDLTPAAQQALAAALEDARTAVDLQDSDRLIAANTAFRAAWLACVGNGRLKATIARFVDHVQAVRLGTLRNPGTGAVVIAGLEDLYEAFAERDAVAASDRMLAFVMAAEKAFFAQHAADEAEPVRRAGRRRS